MAAANIMICHLHVSTKKDFGPFYIILSLLNRKRCVITKNIFAKVIVSLLAMALIISGINVDHIARAEASDTNTYVEVPIISLFGGNTDESDVNTSPFKDEIPENYEKNDNTDVTIVIEYYDIEWINSLADKYMDKEDGFCTDLLAALFIYNGFVEGLQSEEESMTIREFGEYLSFFGLPEPYLHGLNRYRLEINDEIYFDIRTKGKNKNISEVTMRITLDQNAFDIKLKAENPDE